jgi:hypothetical protein
LRKNTFSPPRGVGNQNSAFTNSGARLKPPRT